MNGSVGFLCNLRNVVQWTFINPQGSGLVIINFILLDIYLHAREHRVVLRAGTGEQGAAREARAGERLRADAAGALPVGAAIVTVAPFLVVRVMGEHGLDVESLHPVSQSPGWDVMLHARPIY